MSLSATLPQNELSVSESQYNVWVERSDAAFVFNALSGALLKISAPDYQTYLRFMAGDRTAQCPPIVLANLLAGMMLKADGSDEIDLLAKRYESSRNDRSHFALTVVTSLGCNFDCPYCFEDKYPSIMGKDVQELVLKVLDDQLAKIKSFHVTWFGGEPLVGKKSLLALSDAFIKRCDDAGVGYNAQIITNGYLLDAATCQQLRERRVHGVQVGLDGPPDVHDRMRPLSDGRGSFRVILSNLHHAVDLLDVAVRVNVDAGNIDSVEDLFRLLVQEGFAGKLNVYPGQIVGVRANPLAPSAKYSGCFSNPEFARVERSFLELAQHYGLASPQLPRPTGAPCTAVRANELVVGSNGELHKCWDTVGDRKEVIGHISDYTNLNGRLARWLAYEPFTNDECRGCIALPVCMGGCAHHAFDDINYENRCGTFRYTFLEQVQKFVDVAEKSGDQALTYVNQLARRMDTR